MKEIHLDLETRSSVDLVKSGAYRYASSPDFEILLLGYSIDGGEVRVVDLASGEAVPEEVLHALTDDSIIKWAHNSAFERITLSHWLRRHRPDLFNGVHLDPSSWRCTMVLAAYNGKEILLGVRPEDISEGGNMVMDVTTNENLGMNTLVHGHLAGNRITAKLKGWTDYRNGDQVRITFGRMHFFDKETTQAIRKDGKAK